MTLSKNKHGFVCGAANRANHLEGAATLLLMLVC